MRTLLLYLLASLVTLGWPARGALTAAPRAQAASSATGLPTAVPAEALDRAITDTLAEREYAWRLPAPPNAPKTKTKGWFSAWGDGIARSLRGIGRFVGRIFELLGKWLRDRGEITNGDKYGFDPLGLPSVVYALLGLGLVLLLASVWRRRRRRAPVSATASPAPAALPDIAAEETTADQLPEAQWLQLAQECAARGEYRLAVRAEYLAALSFLHQREMLALARFKSNLDYRRELARRAAAQRELVATFAVGVREFERAWYGRAPVTAEAAHEFAANLRTLRAA